MSFDATAERATVSAHPEVHASAFAAEAQHHAARYDIYAAIHRALRLFMSDTLGRVGWLDTSDAAEVAATLNQVNVLLELCRSHLDHENRFVHPALEARRPGASARIADEHVEHHEAIAALQAEAAALRAAPTLPFALRFYRHLALFVAHNFEHMQLEETQHNAQLWADYSDAEIVAIEQRLVASIAPEEMAVVLHWMARAIPPAERAGWIAEMRAQMPPQVFAGVQQVARAALDDKGWNKLAAALNLAAA